MRTTYKEYGCTASITDKQDGTARLIHEDTINGTLAVLRQRLTKEC